MEAAEGRRPALVQDYIRKRDPDFDVAKLELHLRRRVERWANKRNDAFRQWIMMRDALTNAADYLKAHPKAVEESLFSALIEGFLSTPCLGNNGKYDLTIGERLEVWREAALPSSGSARSLLIAEYENAPQHVGWWKDRKPTVRDLAVLTLLADQWPEAARKAQVRAGRFRRTVVTVVRAAENAVSATISSRRSRAVGRKSAPGHRRTRRN